MNMVVAICFWLECSLKRKKKKPCPFSLTDIDGLESSAIGGQLMASASMESPFTQGRRIDDSTVAGSDLGLEFMNIHPSHVLPAIKLLCGSFLYWRKWIKISSWQKNTWWKLLASSSCWCNIHYLSTQSETQSDITLPIVFPVVELHMAR